MPALSRSDIAQLVREAVNVIVDWEGTNDSAGYVRWRGGQRKAISDPVATAWGNLLTAIADNDAIADDAKSLVIEIDRFDGQLADWENGISHVPEDTDPAGSPSLWSAWAEVQREAFKPINRKLPTPIRELVDVQKVPDRQIAIQYGWFRSDGTPDLAKVREEVEQPGKHFNPETWVHPSERRRAAAIAEVWAKRVSRWSSSQVGGSKKEAKETLDELIFQEVPSKQIAMMKGIGVDEVKARAAYLGVPLDGVVPNVPVSPADRLAVQREEDEKRRAAAKRQMEPIPYPDQKRLPEKIAAMAVDGMTPAEIVDSLRPHFPSVSPEKVLRVIEESNQPTA